MADRILMGRVNTQIEMNIVCSDYSLLENINGYLCKNGIIGIRDGDGALHYIVDGRHDRLSASRKVSTIVAEQSLPDDRNDDYYDSCAKAVFREHGLDFKHIGSVMIYDAIKHLIYTGADVPINMKTVYIESAGKYMMNFSQVERDVRYSLKRSNLGESGSRNAMRTLMAGISARVNSGNDS